MELNKEIVFCYLEEDNAQRAYFRILPLLTQSGECREEALQLWHDDGALRIVPDRNEQGYFKDRMRAMGRFCLMDLTPFAVDANKIRTNKNYRPNRDERNQYILYSDAVCALPEHTFLQVIEADPQAAEELAKDAATPLFMIRSGDVMYGPVKKSAPEIPGAAPKMTAALYELTCPDGSMISILCTDAFGSVPKTEQPVQRLQMAPVKMEEKTQEAPAQQETAEPAAPAEALPIGQKLEILEEGRDYDESISKLNQPVSTGANLLRNTESSFREMPVEPVQTADLTGTPLSRTAGLRTSMPKPKNRLQEVVASQWNAIRNDPPAEPLPEGTTLHEVVNPVERACEALKGAWVYETAQQQLVDQILSLPGMSTRLLSSMTENCRETPLQQALQTHLNDLEAERLKAIVTLDKARQDLESFRKSTMESIKKNAAEQLKDLEAQQSERTSQLKELNDQVNRLSVQKDELAHAIARLLADDVPEAMKNARLVLPVGGQPMRISSRVGVDLPVEATIERFNAAINADDAGCSRDLAAVILSLMATCTKIGLPTTTPGSGVTLIRNVCTRLGWSSGLAVQTNAQQAVDIDETAGNTPKIILSTLPSVPRMDGATLVQLCDRAVGVTVSMNYQAGSWPMLPQMEIPFIEEAIVEGEVEPLSLGALKAEKPSGDLKTVLSPLFAHMRPLSGKSFREMERFVAVVEQMLDGGFHAAVDWAIQLWILPLMTNKAGMLAQLNEYPLSRALIG